VSSIQRTRTRDRFERLERIAAAKGGICLSKTYNSERSKLRFQCARSHIWETQARCIVQGSWCRRCFNDARKTGLERFRQIAAARGGKCLSEVYTNNDTKLRFRCAKGHEWKAWPDHILKGGWCRRCWIDSTKLSLDEVRKTAERRSGRCLSDAYVDSTTKLRFECAHGHVFELRPGALNRGVWCRKCHVESIRLPLAAIRRRIEAAGGRLLSNEYVDRRVEFVCANGHLRQDRPYSVLKLGVRCWLCWMDRIKRTIADMQRMAKRRGGKCVSTEYVNVQTKLIWQCAYGHQWLAVPNSIQRGTWCPVCARRPKRKQAKTNRPRKWLAFGKPVPKD